MSESRVNPWTKYSGTPADKRINDSFSGKGGTYRPDSASAIGHTTHFENKVDAAKPSEKTQPIAETPASYMLKDRMTQLLDRSHQGQKTAYLHNPSLVDNRQKELDKQIPVPGPNNPNPSLLEGIRRVLGLPPKHYLFPENEPKTK